jgi:flagellar hook-associated protein 2
MSSLIQPLVFTGISQYSQDFQAIMDRALQLGSLPLRQLQNQQADLQERKVLAGNLSAAVAELTSSISSLGTLGDNQALTAKSSNTAAVTATVTGASQATSYTVTDISSIARAASESSLTVYPDASATAVSTTGTVRLTVGSQHVDLTLAPGKNNLQGVRDAINAANAGATATILTTTAGAYLSVASNNLGATTLTLTDDPTGANTNLLTSTNQGANTVFVLNGVPVSEPSTQINNVVPGLTLSITAKTTPGETIDITLQSDRSKLSSALQGIVSRYNSVATQVNAQIGPTAGLLSGNSIIRETRAAMTRLVNHRASSGSVLSFAELGISLSQTGQMSFDGSRINGLSDSQLQDAFEFVSSGVAGLANVKAAFSQLSSPTDGIIRAQINQFTAADQRISRQVTDMTTRLNLMQTTIQAQLQAADAALARLESQQNVLTASIESLNYTTYGKKLE